MSLTLTIPEPPPPVRDAPLERAWAELLAGFSEPVVVMDATGVALLANRAMAALMGLAVSEVPGCHLRQFLPSGVASMILAIVGEVILDGRVRASVNMTRGYWWRRRYWRVTREGGEAVCAMRCDPWRAPIMGGASACDPEPAEIPHHDLGDLGALSAREGEVLWLVGRGKSQIAIARELSRSPKTVETHLRSISAKLRLRGRVALAALAQERGLTMMTREQVERVFGRTGAGG